MGKEDDKNSTLRYLHQIPTTIKRSCKLGSYSYNTICAVPIEHDCDAGTALDSAAGRVPACQPAGWI